MKTIRRGIACALCAALLLCAAVLPASAASVQYPDAVPVVLIHGIFQSQVFLADDAGERVLDADGKPIQGWPPEVDLMALAPPVILPLLASLLLQNDIFLTKTLGQAVLKALDGIRLGKDGMPVRNLQVRRFVDRDGKPMSIAQCDQDGKNFIYSTLPLQDVSSLVGEDKVYYFAYDSLGNHEAITAELLAFIKGVSEQHGGSQVKIIPISLGGTFANSLIDYYYDSDLKTAGPGGAPLLHSIVYVIPALDGSRIAGDIFLKHLSTDNKDLYHDMFPLLVDGYTGPLINIALRLLPKRVLLRVVDGVLDALIGKLISYSTTLWALVPSGDYPQAREMWLMDEDHAEIRRQTDRYYQAQKNSRANILRMKADGVHVYDIVEYNMALYSIAGSCKSVNSDTLIQVDSASMGATSVMPGHSLPADYVPKNPYCTNPAHNHFDDSRTLDASTGALPENTWYFKDSNHERTGRNDVILRLVTLLATTDDYIDVHALEAWPQFNYGRTPGELRGMIEHAERSRDAGIAGISAADAAELDAATLQAQAVLEKTIVVPGEYEAALGRLSAILVKLGLRTINAPDQTETILEAIFGFLSDALYYAYGPRGFSDFFWAIWQ